MKKMLPIVLRRSAACAALCSLFTVSSLHAATQMWTGAGANANWLTPGNWLSGSAPLAGDSLIFTNATRLNNTNNFPAATAFGDLTFATPAGAFSLNGNAITLNGNVTDNQPVTVESVNLDLSLGITPTVDVAPNGVLTINGVVSGSSGLTKTDAGLLNLTAANTFTGALAVDGGGVAVSSDGNLGAVPGSATPGSIVLNGGALEATASLTLNANRGVALGSGAGGFGILTVDTGSTLIYGGVIANNGGTGTFTKNGYGALVLSGQNTYSGATSNRVGALTLDFSQAGAPTVNIIPATSDLTLGGENAGAGAENEAQLNVIGNASTVNSQSFNSTHLTFAGSIVQATSGSGGAMNLNLGALSHDPGGALLILPPQIGGGAGNITTTSGNINGLLGGYATIGDGTTYSANGYHVYYSTNFAAVDGSGNIVNFTDYFQWASGNLHGQVTIASNLLFAPAGPSAITVDNANANSLTEVNTINISAPETGTTANYYGMYLGDGNTLRLGKYGGILKTDRSEDVITIGGVDGSVQSGSGTAGSANIGTLTAGGADNADGEIVMTADAHDESHGTTIFECKITDNGNGKVTFVKMGPGSIKLDGHNTFSGGLYLLQGRVQFAGHELDSSGASDNPDGGGTGPIYILPGSYLFPSGIGSGVITNDIYVAGRGTAAEPLGAIRSGNFSSTIHLIGNAQLGGGTYRGPIVGGFNLGLCMPAVTHGDVHLANSGNDWTGDTIMNAEDHSGTITQHVYNETNDVIPDGFGRGNVIMEPGGGRSTSYIVWDLHGFNETINGLSTSGNHVEDCIITNSAAAGADSVLTVGNNNQSGTFAGEIGDAGSGSGALGLTKIGGGVETLTGANTYSGPTVINGGTLALSGSGSINNTPIQVNGDGTLDVSALNSTFSTTQPLGVNGGTLVGNASVGNLSLTNGSLTLDLDTAQNNITAAGLATGGTTNRININSVAGISAYPAYFTVIKYSGSLTGANNFGLGTVPNAQTVGFVSNDVANSSIILVLLNGPKILTWTGTDPTNPTYWDVDTTVNWLAFKGTVNEAPSVFNQADAVTFDDTGSSGTVSLQQSVSPGSVLVTNDSLNYTFTGPGAISGKLSMTKDGTGSLILDNGGTSGVSLSGRIAINAGTVQVGNNDTNGNLSASAGIINNGSLVFERSDNIANNSAISGGGTLMQNGAGVLTLSGNNTFTGEVDVAQSTLKAGSDTALGTGDGSTVISSGATLDVNGHTLDTEPVVVSGTGVGGLGAIINSGAQSLNAMGDVTLAGDTSLGGSGGRWDIRGGAATLSTSGNAYSLTKVGTNYVALVGVSVDGALADINVNAGTLSIETTTSGLGNSGNALNLAAGATLQLYGTTATMNKQFNLNGDGVTTTLNCANGTGNNLSGNVTLTGSCLFNANSGTALAFNSGTIGGSGSFLKLGAGTNLFGSGISANYTGGTTISNGVLGVNGTLAGNVTIAPGATLGGTGTAGDTVTVTNGTLLPGDVVSGSPGTLTLGALTMNHATAVLALSSATNSGNDEIAVTGTLSFAGTNTIQIVPQSFMNIGDVYTLFTYGGATLPSSVTNNVQLTTSAGFAFSVIDPAATPGKIQIHVDQAIGNILWTGQSSSTWNTNDINWNRSGNAVAFNDGDFANFDDTSSVTNVSLSGALQIGNLTMNNSSEAYTFGGSGALTGGGGLTLSGSGGLTIANAGSNSFTGPILINAGTLQVGDGGTNGNLGLGAITNNGTLALDRGDNKLALNNAIAGTGGVIKNGSGEVTLGGANSFDGEVDVNAGTLGVANSGALGDNLGETVVNSGASLDIANTANVAAEVINVSGSGPDGSGAIVNNSGSAAFSGPNVGNVYMAGDVTIGGPGRLDFRASSATAQDAILLSFGSPFTLTKSGAGLLQLAGVQIDPGLGDINVDGGTLGLQWQMPSLGDASYHLNVAGGAALAFFDLSNAVSKILVLSDGSTVLGQHGDANVFAGPTTLQGNVLFNVTGGTLTFANRIDGLGSLVKAGGATLVLSTGPEAYVGNTYVNGGVLALMDGAALTNCPGIILSNATIDVSARTDGTLSVGDAIGQTLAGGGTINGILNENAGSTVNPGNGLTTAMLTVTNSATLNGKVLMDLNRNNALTADEIVSPAITANGTITVTNLGPDLETGDVFQLFSVAISGSPTVNLPTHSASGAVTYTWQNNLAVDGTIKVASGAPSQTPPTLGVTVGSGGLTLSWPTNHTGWTLQVQTNSLDVGLSTNWVDVPDSTSTNAVTVPLDANNDSVFYRLIFTP